MIKRIIKLFLSILKVFAKGNTLIVSGDGNKVEQIGKKGGNRAIIRGSNHNIIQRSNSEDQN